MFGISPSRFVHPTCICLSVRHFSRKYTWYSIVCCMLFAESKVYNHSGHMGSSGGSHFVGFPPASVDPRGYILPLVLYERWDDCRPPGVKMGCLRPRGRQQLESFAGLNLAWRGNTIFFRLKSQGWPLGLWPLPISQITWLFNVQSSDDCTMLKQQSWYGSSRSSVSCDQKLKIANLLWSLMSVTARLTALSLY